MTTEWYYESMGQILGPVDSSQLLQKVRSGEISENTRVRKDDSQWVNAGEVNGLFQAAKRALVQYKCPYCGARIDKPPAICLECDREVTAAYRQREKVPPPEPSASKNAPQGAAPAAEPANGEGEGTIVHAVISWLKTLVR